MSLDLFRARVRFRDRAVADVLDLALRFVVVHGAAYAKLALVTVLPAFVIAALLARRIGPWAWLAAIPLALLAEAPFTTLASRLVFEDRVRVREVVARAVADAPRVLFTRLLALVVASAAALLFAFPGVVVYSMTYFLPEVMVLERGRVLGRAQELTSNATAEVALGAMLGVLVTAGSVLLADAGGRTVLGELLLFRPPPPVWQQGIGTLALFGLFAHLPYRATARFFLYLNVRTRAEGWDIQTRFAALARQERDA